MSSNVLMQCLLGIQCNDFAMVAADQTNSQSILVMKHDEIKFFPISEKLVMGVNGDAGDTAQFAQFIAKNMQLYKMRNFYQLSTSAAVHFTRKNLAEALRTQTPYMVNLLIGGFDEENGGQLYYMDYLASSVRVPFAVHGFGGLLSLSILDRYHKPDLTESEAYEVLKLCVSEVHKRLFVNLPNFQVCVVNKNGIGQLPVISPQTVAKN